MAWRDRAATKISRRVGRKRRGNVVHCHVCDVYICGCGRNSAPKPSGIEELIGSPLVLLFYSPVSPRGSFPTSPPPDWLHFCNLSMPSKPGPGSINQLVRFPLIFTAASRSICCSLLCRANRGSPRPTRLRLPVCKTSHTTSTPACQRFRTGGGLWCHCIRQQHGISFFFFFAVWGVVADAGMRPSTSTST
jgi:hypothetical protein